MALPGVRTTILDRTYTQTRTDLPGGPLIAVIGKRSTTATSSSPDLVPYYAVSESDAITQFGEDSQLHRAFFELSMAGASRVVLIPLPSDTTFDHNNAYITSSTFPSYTTDDLFDEVFAAAESVRADIIVPWGRGGDTTDWDDYATPDATPGNNSTDYFYADNSATSADSWAVKVATKCYEITYNSYPVLGVMGVAPIPGAENPTPSQLSAGLAFSDLFDKETWTSGYDYGAYLNIVAAELHPIGAPDDWGWSNGACTYAAMIARLESARATTNKPVFNVDKIRYNLTRTQAETVSGKGLVGVQLDFALTPKWVDGTTFAKATSDFTRLSTFRICVDVVKLIKSISQNYIGEGMSVAMQNAFQTQISSGLQSMTKLGAINQSDFVVQYVPSTNTAEVSVAVVPAFELREVVLKIFVNF